MTGKTVRGNVGRSANPAKPLSHVNRELFAQKIASGWKLEDAYREAGYKGNVNSRRMLRRHVDIDRRIMFLLDKRIADDTKRRHKLEKSPSDIQAFVSQKLIDIADNDIRDIIQWKTVPTIDQDGNVTGSETILAITPSHKLTKAQAAALKRVSMKGGMVNLEWSDPLVALDKLGKSVGMFQDAGPSTVNNTQNINNTVLVGQQNASDAIRRLAFAIQKIVHSQELIEHKPMSHASEDGSEG